MTDAAPGSPVEALKSKLAELSEWRARCQEAARIAADNLISEPSVEGLRERDRQRELAEVADLEVERVKRALVAAEEEARQGRIAELLSQHSIETMGAAQEADRALREAVAACETALSELQGLRNRARATVRSLNALGHNEAVQIGVRPDDTLIARMQALAGTDKKPGLYQAALKRVDTGQISGLALGRTG